MQTLLQRLESLTAPSREVSDELLLSWGWRLETLDEGYWRRWTWPNGDKTDQYNSLLEGWHIGEHSWDRDIPHPTASIDDAKLGLPTGSLWATGSMEEGPFARVVAPRADGFYTGQSDNVSYACTEAIALCIAIVNARGGV